MSSPLPPPSPPPAPPAAAPASLSTLVSYPSLIPHEEALASSPYDVRGWAGYLAAIDSILDVMGERYGALQRSHRRDRQRREGSEDGGRGKGRAGRGKRDSSLRKPLQAGGRTVRLDAPGAATSLAREIRSLQAARAQVSERCLGLVPGSYKLWRDYLDFRSGEAAGADVGTGDQVGAASGLPNSPQAAASSPHHRRYRGTVSAYERSLVRCNKYPRIWLSYAAYVVRHDPMCSPTNVRRLYDRALLALPATQHQKVWDEYLCWATGGVVPWLNNPAGRKKLGPVGLLCLGGGFGSPVGAGDDPSNAADGDGDGDDGERVPAETVLRVVRRYVHSFDPSAREILADLCLDRSRWGEAASLLVSILNDGTKYLSPRGTTRHELWLKLAEVCTEHPREVRTAGVDFDAIVRAAIGGPMSTAARAKEVWEVFDHLPAQEEEAKREAKREAASTDTAQGHAEKDDVPSPPKSNLANLGELEGTLWAKLATYHTNSGEFEIARGVYEEAMESVSRVRDFSLIFDEYMKLEEGVVEAMMELMEDDGEEGGEEGAGEEDEEDFDILLGDAYSKRGAGGESGDDNAPGSADIELSLARAENLTARRPILLNRVLLRQNPNNVGEWTRRSTLYLELGQTIQAINALEEGIKTVNAGKAVNGSPSELWTSLAHIYEDNLKNDDSGRETYERACRNVEYAFIDSDDLAKVWAAWVEFELRKENWDAALSVVRQSVSNPEPGKRNRITRGLGRSLRLWNLLLDLEESLGTVQTAKDGYNRAMELKVATPSQILNFASFLVEHKYFEESFNAYERGVELFAFPHPGGKLIWKAYLDSFLKRYEGNKIPRTRELFDRCLEVCPIDQASEFFLMYGSFEENYGLTKRALSVYEKMCTTLPPEEKFSAYQIYIAKTTKYLGVPATRPLYERAISALEDEPAAKMCLEFSKMEIGLGEVDRARTAITYGSQLADPRRFPEYWSTWHDFEVQHGNEETFREMLRIKRSVQAAFSTVNYNAAEMGAGISKADTVSTGRAMEELARQEGVTLSKQPRVGGFVQGKRTAEIKDLEEVERRAAKIARHIGGGSDVGGGGGDEIDIDDDDETEIKDVETKAIPAAVLGGLATKG